VELISNKRFKNAYKLLIINATNDVLIRLS
jgi:hypothetical protein